MLPYASKIFRIQNHVELLLSLTYLWDSYLIIHCGLERSPITLQIISIFTCRTLIG